MARVWTSDNFTSRNRGDTTPSGVTPNRMTANGPWSRWLAALGTPVRGLAALVPGFQLRSGASITPRLRLLYPLRDGYRVEEKQLDRDAPLTTWVADHLGLGTRVEVTFANARSMLPSAVHASREADRGAASAAVSSEVSSELPSAAAAFQSRARVTAQINEPHLVRILEQGSVKGLPFIVTELLEGRSLRQRLLQGPVSLDEAQTVVVQACDALAKAHAFGIAHGGLRPDVLYLVEVAEQPFLKIGGFGVSPTGTDASARNTYASPEQLLLDARSDVRSDLWALAVSAYELLTTTLPFEATTPAGVTVAICNGQFAQPSQYRADLPRAIDGWFATALAKDPAQRFADATELARGFVRALTASVEATAPKPSSPISTILSASSSPSFPDPGLADALEGEESGAPSGDLSPAALSSIALPSVPPPFAASSGAPPLPPPLLGGPEALEDHVASSGSRGEFPLSPDADDGSLEMDDGEEDEKTVKWDSPSELPSSFGRAPAAILASVVPHPLGGSPNRVSAAIPGVASARQGAVTQRLSLPGAMPGSSLPLGSNVASPLPLGVPPTLEPSLYLDSPYIASVASALAVPSMPVVPEAASRAQPLFTPDKTWLAALAFAAGVAVTWFAYEPKPEGEAVAPTAASPEFGPDGIRTVSVNDLPPVAGEEAANLPAILLPSQLPRATDEAGEPREIPILSARTFTAPAVKAPAPSAPRAAVQKVQALTPAPQPAKAAVRTKVADGSSNCSPPYQIDSQGIQRLKAECLNRTVVAGPYGAVMTSSAVANQADPAKNVSANGSSTKTASAKPATSDKQARSSTSCSPPYYFDGKIRRLKLECL